MDSTIIAAIIGAIAAIVAALIGTVRWKHKVAARKECSKECFEKSKWLRLGYVLAALECYLDAQKMGISTSTDLSTTLEVQTNRAYEIGKELGISVDPDASILIRELPLKLDAKPIAMKNAFRIGNIIGRIYFYGISLMVTGSLPPIDEDIERLGEAEQLLRGANLPSDFLKPVRKLWRESLQRVPEGTNLTTIDNQMEDVLDGLCKDIETDFRHGV